MYAPAAMMGYFVELGDAAKSNHLDDQHLSEIARRYGIEVVGPVPETYA